jgi:ABC-type multidrug transport system ATPase subunit
MEVVLNNIGKRFNQDWIFRNITLQITPETPSVITGANGSGKSTLLQAISSATHLSEGKITYNLNNNAISIENIYQYISIAAPYLELIEEYSLKELISFQMKFKPFSKTANPLEIIEIMQLQNAQKKYIKQFSSGMKQRVKLALAILSNTPILLLDEPCSNLDKQGIAWYQNLITEYGKKRIIIVCSNSIKEEFFFCKNEININNYKL